MSPWLPGGVDSSILGASKCLQEELTEMQRMEVLLCKEISKACQGHCFSKCNHELLVTHEINS